MAGLAIGGSPAFAAVKLGVRWRMWKWRSEGARRGLAEESGGDARRGNGAASSNEKANGPSHRQSLHVNATPSESPNGPPIVMQTPRHVLLTLRLGARVHVDVKPSNTGKRSDEIWNTSSHLAHTA